MEASGGLILIRMRLSGGSQVAGESRAAAAGVAEVGAAARGSQAASARATSGIRGSIRGILSNSMKLRAVGRTMTMGLSLPIIAAGAYAIHTAAEFDTSMAQVKAATGVGSDGLDDLRKLALQMGADTIFSANEAAQAMLELSKGGMTPAQIRAGALDASLKLAAAGGIDLATAANQVTRSMNTFHLPASKAGDIANALAGAANASSADLSDLSLAFSQAGTSAQAAGFSVNETAGILGAFADAGVIGSDAGTSLKTMLQRLVPQSDEAAAAMKQYGLDFFDANGHMKSATEIAGTLQKGLGGLSQEERSKAMTTIFGSDAQRAANILTDQGAKGLAKYIKATQDQDAAQKMADARMTGLSGALETLKGSIETAALSFGEALKPAIVAIAGVLTTLANAFTALPPEAQTAIAVFLLLIAFAGPLIFILGTLAAAATILGISLGALLIGLGLVALVMAVVVVFVILYNRVHAVRAVVDAVFGFIKAHWPLLVGLFMPVVAVIVLVIRHFGALKSAVGAVFGFIGKAAGGVGGAIAAGFNAARGVVVGVLNFIIGAINTVIDAVDDLPGVGNLHEIGQIGGASPGAMAGRTGGAAGAGQHGAAARRRAVGGPVFAGMPYTVGERGRELFVPDRDGTIVPHGRRFRQEPKVRGAKRLRAQARTAPRDRQPIILQVDGRTLAETTVQLQDDEDARR